MNFFELKTRDTIDVGGVLASCVFCTSRSASFEMGEQAEDGYRQTGWLDIHWIGDADDGLVHLRFALRPSVATIRFTNQIRDVLYARLGIPVRTLFKQCVVNFDQTVEIHDDRACFVNGITEWDAETPDFSTMPLFESPFVRDSVVDGTNEGG